MNKRKLIVLIMVLLTFTIGVDAQLNYGLRLRSLPDNIGQRTTFNLLEKGEIILRKNFNLSFNLFINNVTELGYICHVVEDSTDICLMYFPHGDVDSSYFDVIIKGKERLLRLPVAKKDLNQGNWHKIELSFMLNNDSMKLSVGDSFTATPFQFNGSYSPGVVFGTYKTSVALPSVSIKDIILRNSKNEALLNYPLNEYMGTSAIDINGANKIDILNPNWLARDHYRWNREHDIVSSSMATNCFIPDKNEIYLIGPDSVLVFSIKDNFFKTLKYANDFPLTPLYNEAIYNPDKDAIDVYGFINGNSYHTEKRISSLNLDSLKWMEPELSSFFPEHCHHNAMYIDGIEYPVVFGGYGNLKYFDEFITYQPDNMNWREVEFSGDSINPRFLASISQKVGDKYYLFGGFGNESGDQELGGINFYDLYEIDTKNRIIKKIWQMPAPEHDFVGANTMVYDETDNVFYVLGYAHHQQHSNLVLYRLDYLRNNVEIVSDSIPVSSQTIYSKKNLFLSDVSNKLVAAIREDPGSDSTIFRYYTLHFPPIKPKVAAKFEAKSWWKKNGVSIMVLSAIVLVVVLIIVYSRAKRKDLIDRTSENKEAWNIMQIEHAIPDRNVILFFGEFVAINSNGKNISHLFSPRLCQLLFLIISHQIKNKEGISSNQISKTLWPDKELVETKNIRSVTISNLRNALKEIDGIEVLFEHKYWKISTNHSVFVDLLHFSNIMSGWLVESGSYACVDFLRFLRYSSRGNLVMFITEEWAEGIRFEVDSDVIEILSTVMDDCWGNLECYKLGLLAASSILKIAPFNEDAIQMKIRFLLAMKEVGVAADVYDKFIVRYKKHFNQKPSWNFADLSGTIH